MPKLTEVTFRKFKFLWKTQTLWFGTNRMQ